MVPAGTGAEVSWRPAISLCWRCRPTARSSIQWSGFGTICAATGSTTRCFVAWPTSWTPARWRGTGSPPTPAWSAHSARSPGLRLRPLYSGARVVPAIEPWPETKDTLLSRNFRRSVLEDTAAISVPAVSRTCRLVVYSHIRRRARLHRPRKSEKFVAVHSEYRYAREGATDIQILPSLTKTYPGRLDQLRKSLV